MKLLSVPRKCHATEPTSVRLILVEEDATAFEPPVPADTMGDSAPEVVVLVKGRGEAQAEFVDRALRRVAALERADRTITEAIIAAGPSSDADVLDARLANARSLLAHMTNAGKGEIVLMAGSPGRHELLELAGMLTSEATGSVSIRVLFQAPRTEPERKSGIHALLVSGRRDQDGVADALAAG